MKELNIFGILLVLFSNFILQPSALEKYNSNNFVIEAENRQNALSQYRDTLGEEIEYIDDSYENSVEFGYSDGTTACFTIIKKENSYIFEKIDSN